MLARASRPEVQQYEGMRVVEIAAALGVEAPAFDMNSACTSMWVALYMLSMMRPETVPDYVLVVAPEHEGRGVYVELGAALACASAGALQHVAVLGPIQHQSVFFHHPAVTRWVGVEAWLDSLG